MNKDTITQLLSISDPVQETPPGKWKRASVLSLFVSDKTGFELLFTRRTDHVIDHKGQVSFPGGAVEPNDASLEIAALREADEEVGLKPEKVKILGRSSDLFTGSGWWITPVVGWCSDLEGLTPNPAEVSRIFTIPVHWLANPDNWEYRTFSQNGVMRTNVIYYKTYDNELLWGITAQLVHELLKKIQLMNK